MSMDLFADRAAVERHKDKQRSRITNGSALLPGAAARRRWPQCVVASRQGRARRPPLRAFPITKSCLYRCMLANPIRWARFGLFHTTRQFISTATTRGS